MLVGNKKSYVMTQIIRFLSKCELLFLDIKKLILYNFLTKCISMEINWNLKF